LLSLLQPLRDHFYTAPHGESAAKEANTIDPNVHSRALQHRSASQFSIPEKFFAYHAFTRVISFNFVSNI
jgi:hypothetical protein